MRIAVRLVGAVACVALVGVLARAGIAGAILARGDDAARAGRLAAASAYYDRARAIGGDSFDEVERYTLLALLAPRGRTSPSALRSANAFLEADDRSAPGHFDRGLIEWRIGSYAASARDFQVAWRLGHDPRAATFARNALRRARRGHGS